MHILGRPIFNQEELIKSISLITKLGFQEHINNLIDSSEYTKYFGENIVPFQRCWNSPCGTTTSSFNKTAALMRSYAISDNAIHGRKICSYAEGGKSQLLKELATGIYKPIAIPDNVKSIELRKSSDDQIHAEKDLNSHGPL